MTNNKASAQIETSEPVATDIDLNTLPPVETQITSDAGPAVISDHHEADM